jgi:hypothetical protein
MLNYVKLNHDLNMFDFILFWNIFSENVHLIKQKIIQNQLIW